MKVLLIKPYWPYPYSRKEYTYNRIWPPLSLANCAALLENQGHFVKILDAHALRIKPKDIKKRIVNFDKIFVTSSSLDKWQCPNIDIDSFYETVRYVREATDEVYVTGYHATFDPEHILRHTEAKAVIRGQPEQVVLEICRKKSLATIQGISYLRDGKFFSNGDSDIFDIRHFPVPAFHLLEIRKYKYEILGGWFSLFELSRGCKYDCRFCSKIMYEKGQRYKTADQVRNELRAAIEHNGVKNGYFIDLDFLGNREVVEQMCDFLISKNYNFNWCCQTRPSPIDFNLLEKMKRAGCRLIHFGVESGKQKHLDLAKKNIDLRQISEVVRSCHRLGIKTLAFYVFGFKGETEADREQTFAFAKKLNTDFVSFHKFYPYKESSIYLEDLSLDQEIDKFIRRIFIRYFFRLSYLNKADIFVIFKSLRLFLGMLTSR